MQAVFRVRYLSVIAVLFGAIGAVLMFAMGGVTTLNAIGKYLGSGKAEALSDDAALNATVEIVSALDQFLLGLVLLVFAYGVYSLWVVADTSKWDEESTRVGAPDWLEVNSVTDLKVKLLEVIAVLLSVLFLKGVLSDEGQDVIAWSELVVPIAVGIFALTVWLIRRAEVH